jgi:undecaprenyl diphosphate synthase
MNTQPKHVAIIMDGNGRWAQKLGKKRVVGHSRGAKTVREIVEEAVRHQIEYLTLFAFSTENWNRPKDEVNILMKLFSKFIEKRI